VSREQIKKTAYCSLLTAYSEQACGNLEAQNSDNAENADFFEKTSDLPRSGARNDDDHKDAKTSRTTDVCEESCLPKTLLKEKKDPYQSSQKLLPIGQKPFDIEAKTHDRHRKQVRRPLKALILHALAPFFSADPA